jgi:Tol biopolymer transport system component
VKRGERTELAVVPSDGGPVRTLAADPEQNWPFGFSPDGGRISMAAERNGVWNIVAVPTAGGAPVALTHFTGANGYVRYPAWSPSGRRVVFERGLQTASIWALKQKSQ